MATSELPTISCPDRYFVLLFIPSSLFKVRKWLLVKAYCSPYILSTCIIHNLSPFQIPKRDPDDVPAHPALPDHGRHHQQEEEGRAQGPRQGHPTGTAHFFLFKEKYTFVISYIIWKVISCGISYRLAN